MPEADPTTLHTKSATGGTDYPRLSFKKEKRSFLQKRIIAKDAKGRKGRDGVSRAESL